MVHLDMITWILVVLALIGVIRVVHTTLTTGSSCSQCPLRNSLNQTSLKTPFRKEKLNEKKTPQ